MRFASKKNTAKKVTAISVFAVMLLSQNTAFANQPVATQTLSPHNIAQNNTKQFTQTDALAARVIDVDTHIITATPKANWSSPTVDASQWLLKPEISDSKSVKASKNYATDFTGLRTSVLANNNTKIGTATQYIDANETPLMTANKSSQNLYSKTDDNFLVRAKLDF